VHRDDIVEENREWLEWALGDFEIINTENRRVGPGAGGIPSPGTRFTIWTIEYENYRGEVEELEIRNNWSLEGQVGLHLSGLASREKAKIRTDFEDTIFRNTGRLNVYYTQDDGDDLEIWRPGEMDEEIIRLIRGIKISDFSITTMSRYNLHGEITVWLTLPYGVTEARAAEELLNVFGIYFEYFDKSLVIRLSYSIIDEDSGAFLEGREIRLIYNDGFEWSSRDRMTGGTGEDRGPYRMQQ